MEIYALGGILQYPHNPSLLSHSLTYVNGYRNSKAGYFHPTHVQIFSLCDKEQSKRNQIEVSYKRAHPACLGATKQGGESVANVVSLILAGS